MALCKNFRVVNENWQIFIKCDVEGDNKWKERTHLFSSIESFWKYDSWVLNDKKMWDETWKPDILYALTDDHRLDYNRDEWEYFWKQFTRTMKDTFLKEENNE